MNEKIFRRIYSIEATQKKDFGEINTLKSRLILDITNDGTQEYYRANLIFLKDIDEMSLKLEANDLQDIFCRFKYAEEGIERFFDYDESWRGWKCDRLVMRHIFDLEDKAMKDYEERTKENK